MVIITNDLQGVSDGWDGTITNSCSCANYDEDTDTYTASDECYGDCWDTTLHLLEHDLGDWMSNNPNDWWQVNGLPLWDRNVSGSFHADTIEEFVRGITVNGEWILRYRLNGNVLVARLSHHDVPMGREFTITYATNADE